MTSDPFLAAARAPSPLAAAPYSQATHKNESEYQVWQEGTHPPKIESDDKMRQKIEYIPNNPVQRGYLDHPLHWRHSSAHDYAGEQGLIEVVTDRL